MFPCRSPWSREAFPLHVAKEMMGVLRAVVIIPFYGPKQQAWKLGEVAIRKGAVES